MPSDRTPQDYAIEHAEYMAADAERLLSALAEHAAALMAQEEGTDPDQDADTTEMRERCELAEESLGEAMAHMRSGIYEFRKRRDRAAPEAAPCPYIETSKGGTSYCRLAAPAPAPAQAVQQPLTAEQVEDGWVTHGGGDAYEAWWNAVRWVESMHGIGTSPQEPTA